MRRTAAMVGVVFAVTLAVVIGNRMSADAMAVVVGVACGVLASVPTSLLLVWALGRRGLHGANGRDERGQYGPGGAYPPIVVVNPGTGHGIPGYNALPTPSADAGLPPPGSPRSFKVVGDEETLLDDLQHIFPGLRDNYSQQR